MNPEWRKVGNHSYQIRNIVRVTAADDVVFIRTVDGVVDAFHPKYEGYRDALKLYLEVTPEQKEEEDAQ